MPLESNYEGAITTRAYEGAITTWLVFNSFLIKVTVGDTGALRFV